MGLMAPRNCVLFSGVILVPRDLFPSVAPADRLHRRQQMRTLLMWSLPPLLCGTM